MVDIHSHSIFGVDDGSSSIKQSINMLKSAEKAGYDTICFTPHYMDDGYKTSREDLLDKVEELKKAISKENINIDLKLGEEVFIFPDLADRLDEVVFLNDSKYLLFEVPLVEDITYLDDVIYKLQSKGVVPILAHPERYLKSANDFEFLQNIYNKGVLLQVNINSLIGHYGGQAEKLAKKLLENRMVSFVSTDAHSERGYESTLDSNKVLKKLVSPKYYELLTETNLKKVLNNEEIININEIEEPKPKSFFSRFHLSVVFALILCCSLLNNVSLGATKQDVISAINATYKISDTESYKLPKKYINKGINYLNEHELTSSQYDKILGCIDKAVALVRRIGHTRRKDYTKEQINEALTIVVEACRAAEVDLSEELEEEEEPTTNKQEATSPKAINEDQVKTDSSSNKSQTKSDSSTPKNQETNSNNDKNAVQEFQVDSESENDLSLLENKNVSGEVENNESAFFENKEKKEDNDTFLNEIKENVKKSGKTKKTDVQALINRNITIIISIGILIFLLNIFLIRLILKKKWNKILKKCLIIIFSLIIIADIIALGLFFYYQEEIKLGFEIYYSGLYNFLIK